MLKEHASVFRRLAIFTDICLTAGAFFIGYILNNKASEFYSLEIYFEILPEIVLIYIFSLYSFGMYRSFRTKPVYEIPLIVFKATILGFIAFSSFTYLFKIPHINRSLIFSIFIISGVLIILEKIIFTGIFRYIRKTGRNYRSILIIGTGKRAERFINLIHKHRGWGLKIIGLVDEDETKTGSIIAGSTVLGAFKDFVDIIHGNVVDEVVFVTPRSWINKIEDLMYFCEIEGLKIHLAVDYFELKFSKAKQTYFGGFPLLTFESAPDKLWHLLIKRLFDIVVSGLGLVLFMPVFLIAALIIRLTSEGPVFFAQERCSLNGRRFLLYKFRTMHKDAERQLEDLLRHNEMNGPVFKMTNDPRITPVGRFLRKTSIDELPQLWNVFIGDMSMVGPRPALVPEVGKYASWQRRRLSMRPGITCLWQVNGRNKITDFEEWMKLDLKYIDNWSLWLDARIILKTMPVVLLGSGAK